MALEVLFLVDNAMKTDLQDLTVETLVVCLELDAAVTVPIN